MQDGGAHNASFSMILTRLSTHLIDLNKRTATTFANTSTKYIMEHPHDVDKIGKRCPVQIQIEKRSNANWEGVL